MKFAKLIIVFILFFQAFYFCLNLNLLNKRNNVQSKGSNIFMNKFEYAQKRYIDCLIKAKRRYSNDKDTYAEIKSVIQKLEKWYESQWKFYSKLTESNKKISELKEDYDNFWASIDSAYDIYLEALDYLEDIKISTLKIKKCLNFYDGEGCSRYKENYDVLKGKELERFHKKGDEEGKSFFARWFGLKK